MHLKKRVRVALFAAVASVSFTASRVARAEGPAPGPSGPIKVLQLNFNSEEVPNDKNSAIRDYRFNFINEWIAANEPDIITIEEGWNYHSDPSVGISIARAMGYDVAYRLEMGLPGLFWDSDVVLAKKSFHMTGEVDLKLPHSAPELGDGKTWVIELGAVSYAVGVQLTLGNGEPLLVYATHLIADAAMDRGDQAKAIDQDARARSAALGIAWAQAHVIIAGDFNSPPSDPGPVALTASGYEDAFAVNHPGDNSCSDCSDPYAPWFNMFAIGAGLVPDQTDEDDSFRDDYVWSHSPTFKALSSSLIFTRPIAGIVMTDHYGLLTILGDSTVNVTPAPAHDSEDFDPPGIITLTDDAYLCPGGIGSPRCSKALPDLVVRGPRGVVFQDLSDFYSEIQVQGPGLIYTQPQAALDPGKQVSFSFGMPGTYTYSVRNNVESPNPYQARLSGTIEVQSATLAP